VIISISDGSVAGSGRSVIRISINNLFKQMLSLIEKRDSAERFQIMNFKN
jgi:hypothetical protein